LRQFDVQFFAVSVDSVDANRRFAASLGIDYPILSDPTRDVARRYGVLSGSGYASRWTFYIGGPENDAKDAGRVLAIDKQVSAASHGGDIVATLIELGIPRHA
jgi:thioredoxin-dependent peroxiredoxin